MSLSKAQERYDNMQHPGERVADFTEEDIKDERNEILSRMEEDRYDEAARLSAALNGYEMQMVCEDLLNKQTKKGIERFLKLFVVCMQEVAETIAIENLEKKD